jgi:carbon monoxide dehydrogenase subunit G
MPGSPDVVWGFLQNIEGVARCMPGAKITERLDDTHFKGTVAVKVGPASMSFKGNIEVLELDAVQWMLHLVGKGSDSSGTSGASMDLIARVEPGATPDSSNLIGKSEVSMSGKAAAFGGRMMGTVADQILNQFAGNFAKQVAAIAAATAEQAKSATSGDATASATTVTGAAAPTAATAASAAPATAAATPTPTSASATTAAPMAAAAPGTPNSASSGAAPTPAAMGQTNSTPGDTPTSAATGPALAPAPIPLNAANDLPDEPVNEINALALIWAIIRDWFRGLFRRKPA